MELNDYIERFDSAAARCVEFSQQFLLDELPTATKFDLSRGRRRGADETIKFLGGRLLQVHETEEVDHVSMRRWLWVDGQIPVWINFAIRRFTATHTIIEVCTSGTLTDDDNLLYHKREGLPPFHILGPAVPADWVSLERSGKFNLRPWNRD